MSGATGTAPERGFVRLRFETDWHVGTGAGIPGLLDKLIARDPDGLPQVPAKSLFGLWRDAAQTLAWGLDEGDAQGTWHRWIVALFGSEPSRGAGDGLPPRPAALAVGPARLDVPELRPGVPEALRNALTFVKPGVRIRADSGRAEPGHLRFIEMATGGIALRAACELANAAWTEAKRETAWAFLAGALRLLDSAGAGRRRGQGRCDASLDGWDGPRAARLLRQAPEPPPDVSDGSDLPAPSAGAAGARGRRSQRITVRLLAPLVVADEVRGNVVLTKRYIPGSMLLATLFPRIVGALGGAKAREEVARGRLRVLNATPSVPDESEADRRGEIAPLCLHALKEGGGLDKDRTVFNLTVDEEPKDMGRPVQTKPLRNVFVAPAAASRSERLPDFLDRHYPRTAVTTHNTIDDKLQRPIGVAEGGVGPGVYSYESIVSAGPFVAEVRLDDGVPAIPSGRFRARLGRSRKDDYGLAEITVHDATKLEGRAPGVGADGRLWIRLLSDVLPIGEALGPSATVAALKSDLEARLGVTLALLPEDPNKVTVAVRVVRIESWQTRWNLPRPSLCALAAGSVIGFRVIADPDPATLPQRLAKIEATGLGDRRAEGFGEVRFQDPLVLSALHDATAGNSRKMKDLESDPDAPATMPRTEVDKKSARDLVQRLHRIAWQRAIEIQAQIAAASCETRKRAFGLDPAQDKPSASQLGRLREKIGLVRDRQGADRFLEWLDDETQESDPFRSMRRPVHHLLDREATDVLWTELWGATHPAELPGDEAEIRRLKKDLWPLAFRHFVRASLRAHGVAVARRRSATDPPNPEPERR